MRNWVTNVSLDDEHFMGVRGPDRNHVLLETGRRMGMGIMGIGVMGTMDVSDNSSALSFSAPCKDCDMMQEYGTHKGEHCHMWREKPMTCSQYTRRHQWEQWVFANVHGGKESFTVDRADYDSLNVVIMTSLNVLLGILRLDSFDGMPLLPEEYRRRRDAREPMTLYLNRGVSDEG